MLQTKPWRVETMTHTHCPKIVDANGHTIMRMYRASDEMFQLAEQICRQENAD